MDRKKHYARFLSVRTNEFLSFPRVFCLTRPFYDYLRKCVGSAFILDVNFSVDRFVQRVLYSASTSVGNLLGISRLTVLVVAGHGNARIGISSSIP